LPYHNTPLNIAS